MRWLAWTLLAAISAAFACGATAASAPPAPPPAAVAASAPPPSTASERECDELITHAVALGIDEEAEPHTTAADHEAVRRQLHADFMARCRALPQDAVRCGLAAASLDALAACQRTPSSSTSNSKVAPPGITPPAPREP